VKKNPAKRFSDVSVSCDASYPFRVGTFALKVCDDDGEASMSGRYDIIMSYFAEVRVQRLIKNDFSFRMVYGIQLGAKDGAIDLGSILSTMF
jgi:hypothetical protein